MNLADYQWEMIDQIYHLLTDDDHNKVISLHGDTGCGKSTIALEISNQLKEGWSVFSLKALIKIWLHISHGILELKCIPKRS